MMKKALLIIAALFVGMQAHAQLTADGGYFHAFEFSKDTPYASPSQDGVFLGARYEIDLDDWMDGLSFIPGLNVSALKGKVQLLNVVMEKTTTREIAFNLPLQLKYKYDFMSDFAVYGFAGPTLQLGLLNNIVNRSGNSTNSINMYKENTDTNARIRAPFNLYLGLGAGVEVAERILVNVGYDFGLLNLTTAANAKIHRHVLKIGVGYIF